MSHFGLGLIAGQGTPGNDAFTKILLHLDGANGSTTFTDTNAAGVSNSWAAVSNAVISTSGAKFGPSSLDNGASAQGIRTAAKSALDVGTGDFTTDFWFNLGGGFTSGFAGLVGYGNSTINPTQWSWEIIRAGTVVQFNISDGTNVGTSTGTTNVNSGWHHIAVTRASGTVRLFVDGNQEFSFAWSANVPGSLGFFRIGSANSTGGLPSSFIDELRYSVGIARWIANFTPPTSAYI